MKRFQLVAVALTSFCASTASSHEQTRSREPVITPQASGTANRLQAVSPVNDQVVWASGVGGTFVVTTDGGSHWRKGVVAGAETLQFRDVQGVSDKIAYLLASGPGAASRIYKTENGGTTWALQFQAPDDPNYFYDCFAFWSPRRGITMADGVPPTGGSFPAIHTTDGRAWKPANLPASDKNEGAFAASGTCVATFGESRAWIVTTNSRVFVSHDSGNRWAAYNVTPVKTHDGAGLFSVAFRDATHGIVGGGDLGSAVAVTNVARSSDGGKTWEQTRNAAPIPGAIFGLAYAQRSGENNRDDRDRGSPVIVATGPNGTAYSADEGDNWTSLSGLSGLWAVAFANDQVGWLVGTNGQILQIRF